MLGSQPNKGLYFYIREETVADNGILLSDLVNVFPKEKIFTWSYKDVTPNVRVYYKVNKEENSVKDINGFYFHVVDFVSCPANGFVGNLFDNPEVKVETLQHGTAYFDGIRHLYTGTKESDNEGYINYPNMLGQIKIMETLRELEVEYC